MVLHLRLGVADILIAPFSGEIRTGTSGNIGYVMNFHGYDQSLEPKVFTALARQKYRES